MGDRSRIDWGREVVVAALAIVGAVIVIPPIVAALAYQSGQAMFWPALEALYTYFFRYTLLAGFGVALIVIVVRLIIRWLQRSE